VRAIDDSHGLWRRVLDDLDNITWDPGEQRWLIRINHPSHALQFNPEMSVSWREHLVHRHRKGPAAALKGAGDYTLVYELASADARKIRLCVKHSPIGKRQPDCAHTSVEWPEGLTKPDRKAIRSDLAHAMRLVHGVPTQTPPPEA
jgi:hypothetical protein